MITFFNCDTVRTAIAAVALVIASAPVSAQPALQISGDTQLLCLDSTGAYQPVQRANYGKLIKTFWDKLELEGELVRTSDTAGQLIFSGDPDTPNEIVYEVKPRTDGLALLAMRIRLPGKRQDLRGNAMCWRTFEILNSQR